MSKNEQIRREPGFGQGTLRGKLRDYYDPFERRSTASNHDVQSSRSGSASSSIDFPFFYQQPWVWDSDWPEIGEPAQ